MNNAMQAGPQLDFLIGTKVMGWRLECFADAKQTPIGWVDKDVTKYIATPEWSPSTNIAHAWQVVEALELRGGLISQMYSQGGCWSVGIEPDPGSGLTPCYRAVGETAPLAICRAALEAMAITAVR
jgi:hypothetical protein